MSKNKKAILLILSLIMLLIVFIGGYTFSKYISNMQGGGKAEIAKWIFYGGFEEQSSKITLSNTVEKESLVNGKIAPGTSGEFDILIDATGSEVGIEYVASINNENNKPENMKFKVSNSENEYESLEELFSQEIHGVITAESENKKIIIPIEWNWPYESEQENADEIDTINGMEALTYSFSVNIVGRQIS